MGMNLADMLEALYHVAHGTYICCRLLQVS
jgi:hypothetical protein